MSDFVKVANTADVAAAGKLMCEVQDRLVVVVHVDGEFYCVDDVCTHDGGPLGEGELCGFELACPRHGAKFDVRSGEPLTMPATEPTVVHETKVEGDNLFVRIQDS